MCFFFTFFLVTYEAPSSLQPTCIRDFARMSQKWNSSKKSNSLSPSFFFFRSGHFFKGKPTSLLFPENKFENSGKTIPLRLEGGKRETCISSSFSPRDKKSQDLRMFSREGENGVFLPFFLFSPSTCQSHFNRRERTIFLGRLTEGGLSWKERRGKESQESCASRRTLFFSSPLTRRQNFRFPSCVYKRGRYSSSSENLSLLEAPEPIHHICFDE